MNPKSEIVHEDYYHLGYRNDPNIECLKQCFYVPITDQGTLIVGCAIMGLAQNRDKTVFYSKDAKSHMQLKEEVYKNNRIILGSEVGEFQEHELTYGFYTDKGYFLSRVDTYRFMLFNGLPILKEELVSREFGITSENIWKRHEPLYKPERKKKRFPTTSELMLQKRILKQGKRK